MDACRYYEKAGSMPLFRMGNHSLAARVCEVIILRRVGSGIKQETRRKAGIS